MSASTVAVTANPAANNSPVLALGSTRRRNLSVTEKKTSNIELISEGAATASGGGDPVTSEGRDLSHSIRRDLKDLPALQTKRNLGTSTVSPRRRKVVPKPPERAKWQTVASVFGKNFLLVLVLLGLVQIIRKLTAKSGFEDGIGSSIGNSEVEDRIKKMEEFLKTTVSMMHLQLEVVDKKIENEVSGVRRELVMKLEEKGTHFENELKKLEARTEGIGKLLGELKASEFLTKEDFRKFADELKRNEGSEKNDKDLSLDDIRNLARKIVENEIQKHAADGLGKVDYALASAGAMVVGHSEVDPYVPGKRTTWLPVAKTRNNVHPDAIKMLQPSFGEPGQCFSLKGSSGFVDIRLRTSIVPEAVTLEHVAKSVAYDRSSAPKDCRISGWYQGSGAYPLNKTNEKFLLAEFTYDLEQTNAQTFKVDSSNVGIVNMVRFDFDSNHGSDHNTCIYRLRVHGHEADAVAVSPLQA